MFWKLLGVAVITGLLPGFSRIEAQEKGIKLELADTVAFTNKEDMKAHEISFMDQNTNKFGVETVCTDPKKMTPQDHAKGAHMLWGNLVLTKGTTAAFKVNTPEAGTYKLKVEVVVLEGRDLMIKCNGKIIGVIIGGEMLPEDWPEGKGFQGAKEFEFKTTSGGKTVIEFKAAKTGDGLSISKSEVYRLCETNLTTVIE